MTHIDLESLASLAEGRVEPLARAHMCEHLAGCRTCMAAYADAVRYRAAWMAAPEAFAAAPELVVAGLAAADASEPLPGGLQIMHRVEPLRTLWATGPNAWRIAGVAMAAWAAVAIFALNGDDARGHWQGALPAPIRAALETSSAAGFVLPGGERGAASRGPLYRGAAEPNGARLESALAGCFERYEAGRTGPAETYAVAAGFLVTGQIIAAQDHVEEGLSRHPGEPRLLILAADIAYRKSDLERAERYLRDALQGRPRDPVAALNLGIVLAESARPAEAERSLRSVIATHPGTPIAERARRELESRRLR